MMCKQNTLWFTGLSGAGKSTLANALKPILDMPFYVLDGDNLRHGMNTDLSFSIKDRAENIRRAAHICKMLNDAGVMVIACFISPRMQDRALAKEIIGSNNFHEIYIKASLETCIERDCKGLYKQALNSEIQDFTGISQGYEPPINPSITLDTNNLSIEACLMQLKEHLNNAFILH